MHTNLIKIPYHNNFIYIAFRPTGPKCCTQNNKKIKNMNNKVYSIQSNRVKNLTNKNMNEKTNKKTVQNLFKNTHIRWCQR